jgi:predicted metal-dependent phosphoesterase TrpH
VTVDLHVHTTASDGTLTPEETVSLALELALSAIAICDHDSVDGCEPAIEAAGDTALTVVPGVELSATCGDLGVHILGYYLDHTSHSLRSRLLSLRDARMARAQAMVDALATAGFSVTLSGVLEHAGDGSVGRSHIARALVAAGDVDSVEEAFARYIGRGGPYFIEKDLMDGETAIALIHEAGGAAVLAHPGVNRADVVVDGLVSAGLDGLEADHSEHSPAQREHYEALADRLDLVVTGGSDFHGPEAKGGSLGATRVDENALELLHLAAARYRRG